MTNGNDNLADSDERVLQDIFRHAERRPRPRPEARAQAFAALHGEWQAQLQRTRRSRNRRVAAAAAVLMGAAMLGLQILGGDTVRSFDVETGWVRASGNGISVNGQPIDAGRPASLPSLGPGDRVDTGTDGRVALRWDGASLRLDHDTRIDIGGNGELYLRQGALYFDSQPFGSLARPDARLQVHTPLGAIQHLGTQYLAELRNGDVTVSVREGQVHVSGERVDVTVNAGQRARFSADGRFDRDSQAAHADAWQWVAEIAPELDLRGRSTGDLLEWIARETGRELRYANSRARELAQHEPRGIGALSPMPALRTLPFMTSLSFTLTDRFIVVDVADKPKK